jgi:2-polyprenyl-6-methoxyphenol hydroxylase-like FAD-dependent oxidoreductase
MTQNPFKVIVVGGGPVGMTAAHALSRANLDFVVLECRVRMVEDAGSNLVLLPIGLRVLSQLGLLPAIESVSSPMSRFKRIDHNGKDLGDTLWFTYFKEKFVLSLKFIRSVVALTTRMANISQPRCLPSSNQQTRSDANST